MPSSPEGAVMDRPVQLPTPVIEPPTAVKPVDSIEQDQPTTKDQAPVDAAPVDEPGEKGDAQNEGDNVEMQEITNAEVELAGEHILQAEIVSFGKIIEGKTEVEVQAIINGDSTGKMQALNDLYWAQLDNPPAVPEQGGGSIVTFSRKGSSGSVTDVQQIEILSVTGFKDGKFICTALVDGTKRHGGAEATFTREEVQTALLAKDANLKAILASLPEEQREAFQLYVDMKKNGGILPAGTSQEEAQRILTESAESIGLPTGEDLKLMVDSYFAQLIASAGTDIAKIQKYEGLRKSILEDKQLNLDGVIIADGSVLARIFARTGAVSPQSIDHVIEACSRDIADLRKQLEDKKLPPAEKEKLEKELVMVELQKEMTSASKGATSEDEVSKSLDKMMKSGVDLKSFIDAVRTADTNAVVNFIFKNNPTLKEVSDEIKHRHRQALVRKLGKTGGLAALAMAIMMYTAMKGEGKGQ